MTDRRCSKQLLGMVFGGVALASWGLLGFLGTVSVSAGGKPPPPPADPAIAYCQGSQLVVCNADGTNVTPLVDTPNGGTPKYVSWAPDGHSIVFGFDGTYGYKGIYRVDVAVVNGVPVGSNLKQLTDAHCQGLDWSPSGDTIAYYTSGGLYTIPAGGGTPEVIYSGGQALFPQWNPEGTQIAFVYNHAPYFDIKVLELSSGNVSTVAVLNNSQPMTLDWGNTSNLLSYVDFYDNHICVYDIDAGVLVRLSATAWNSFGGATFSPDDSQLVYMSTDRRQYLKTYTLSNGAITTLAARGSSPAWRRNP